MKPDPHHLSRVLASPWDGVYSTVIQSARHYGRHWHGVFGLGLVEEGAHRSASAQGQVDAYAGDLITSNPGEVHDGQPLGGASRRWRMLYLDPEVLNSLSADTAAQPSDALALTRPVLQDEQLRLALLQLWGRLERWQVGASRDSADTLACEESLVHTCGLLLGRHATAARWPEVSADLKQVRDWLADDPLRPPTLTQMAQWVGLSKFQLLRRFDQAYGVTPHAWLLQQRAEKARAVIRQGLGLAEAAAACGFADQSHMTRLFVRHFGFTPGAWQKATVNKPLQ